MQAEMLLVQKALEGSAQAFSEIVRIQQAPIRTYIRRCVSRWEVVDDLAQETFLDAYRTLRSFRPPGPFSSWLFGIARNRVLKHLRNERRTRTRLVEKALLDGVIRGLEQQGVGADRFERHRDALRLCFGALSRPNAALIRQYYMNSRSSADLARRTGRNEGAVRMKLLRIRQALRKCIEAKMSEGAGSA